MAVPEQTPYIEYTANGATTSFSLGFDCDTKEHLIVTVDDVEPLLTDWSLVDGNVVFTVAPLSGKVIKIQRNTPFSRTTDYQSYDNSFRAPVVNKDFDSVWYKLQELGVTDWILSNRIDDLRAYVDAQDDALRATLMAEIQAQGVSPDQLEAYYNYLMQRLAEIAVNRGWEASFVVDASGRTQQEINDIAKNNVANVVNFGAKPQAGFDNRDAFEAAGAYLESIGGGTLYIPDGVFEFYTVFGTNNCCIKPRSNVTYKGNGGTRSVLKFGNGLNSDKTYGCTFIFPPETTVATQITDVFVTDLCFDHNGQNNIMTQPPSLYPFTTGGQAVGIQYGDNIVVERNIFLNNAGRQTVMLGTNSAAPTVKKSTVRHNMFINCGKSVSGNTSQTDHSSVYSICEESDVYENLFFNTSADTVSTAIELHGSRPKAWRNSIYNYGQSFNLAAVVANMNLGCFENNHVENCAHIGTLWGYSGLSLSTKITDNTFVISIANQAQINGITNIQSGVVKNSHTIDENTIIYGGGYTDADYSSFVDIAYLTRLAFRRNKIPEGYAGRAVNISSAKANAVVVLKGNDMQGVAGTSRAGYEECFWLNSGTTSNIKHLTVTDNSAVDCDKYLYTIPNVAATFNNLSERNNTISKTMTDVANIGASVVLGARAAMIDRVTNRVSARASQGSRILDTTTGKRYVKAVNDETSSGWVEDFYSIAVGSGTWVGSTLAANSSRTTTITVSNNITVDNLISFVFPASLQGTIITAEYQDATTVKLTQYNPTASALTFANAVVKVRVS